MVDQLATLKADQKLNAEDDTSDLLAEAEYIFNNADEFLAGVEDYALAAKEPSSRSSKATMNRRGKANCYKSLERIVNRQYVKPPTYR